MALDKEKENPVALAGAHRADVKKLRGSFDIHDDTAATHERQAEYLLRLYGLSSALAFVIAEHAFENGSRP